MDGLAGGAGQIFLKEGLLGALIIIEAIVIALLWRRIEGLQVRIETIQEKRIEVALDDAKSSARVVEGNTTAMAGVRQSLDALVMVVRESRRNDA